MPDRHTVRGVEYTANPVTPHDLRARIDRPARFATLPSRPDPRDLVEVVESGVTEPDGVDVQQAIMFRYAIGGVL